MKIPIIIIMLLLSVGVVSAYLPYCSDQMSTNTNCTMVTPSLNCTVYEYKIYNESKILVEYENLTILTDSIYYFNLTQDTGQYLITLCDGSSKIVKIEGDDDMIVGIIILLPILLAFAFLYWSSQLGEDHGAFKLLLQLVPIPLFLVSCNFALISIAKFFEWNTMLDAIGTTVYWVSLIGLVIGVYFLLYIIIKLIRHAGEQNVMKDQEMHDEG